MKKDITQKLLYKTYVYPLLLFILNEKKTNARLSNNLLKKELIIKQRQMSNSSSSCYNSHLQIVHFSWKNWLNQNYKDKTVS